MLSNDFIQSLVDRTQWDTITDDAEFKLQINKLLDQGLDALGEDFGESWNDVYSRMKEKWKQVKSERNIGDLVSGNSDLNKEAERNAVKERIEKAKAEREARKRQEEFNKKSHELHNQYFSEGSYDKRLNTYFRELGEKAQKQAEFDEQSHALHNKYFSEGSYDKGLSDYFKSGDSIFEQEGKEEKQAEFDKKSHALHSVFFEDHGSYDKSLSDYFKSGNSLFEQEANKWNRDNSKADHDLELDRIREDARTKSMSKVLRAFGINMPDSIFEQDTKYTRASDEILSLLGVTESFLKDRTGIELKVIVNKRD